MLMRWQWELHPRGLSKVYSLIAKKSLAANLSLCQPIAGAIGFEPISSKSRLLDALAIELHTYTTVGYSVHTCARLYVAGGRLPVYSRFTMYKRHVAASRIKFANLQLFYQKSIIPAILNYRTDTPHLPIYQYHCNRYNRACCRRLSGQ